MSTIRNFEEIEIWKMSRELVNGVYSDFRNCSDFGFRDQITRAGMHDMQNFRDMQEVPFSVTLIPKSLALFLRFYYLCPIFS